MSSRVVERAVEGSNGEVFVRREGDDTVIVTWMCGDQRTFDVDGLKEAIKHVEAVKALGDVWVNLKDRSGYGFSGVIVDGEFYADRSVTDTNRAYHVSWDDLKKVLKKAMEQPTRDREPVEA